MVTIVASQAGDLNHYPALSVTNTFNVRSILTLTIGSDHGTATPAPGVYTNLSATLLTNSVTSSVMLGGTQYVCAGWTLAGNDPVAGTTNRLVMTQTNNAVLTWLWITNLPPALSVTPASLDYGTVVVGQATSMAFSVVNTGGQTLTGTAGTGWPYAIVPGSETYSVPAGHTGTVWATFTPPWAGPFSQSITFTSNGGTTNCAVSGNAIWPGWLRVNANDVQSIDFGTVATGTTVQSSFSLINWGDVPIHVTIAQPAAPFAILSDTTFDLAGWVTTNVVVGFTPPDTNSYSANIAFASDGGNATNAVTGSGGYTLVIQSPHGNCTPPPGNYTYAPGTVITNTAIAFDIDGNNHYVCTGWSMAGNEPVSGVNTSMVMTVTNSAVLTWNWGTNLWNGEDHVWNGASTTSDSIDDPDNWDNGIPNPGDNVRLDNTCVRQRPLTARGVDSYFGEITLGFWIGNGMTWCGDKTRLLKFENGNGWNGNTLTSEADLANRIWPSSDLQINPRGGGIVVSNVDMQDGMQLQVYGGNTLTVSGALTQSGTGDATLAILEGGTVILNGPNTLAGGISIGSGTLKVGTGGAAGELGSGSVTNDGALVYNRIDAQTWANVISGLGGVTKRGAGALTLSGENSYAGGLQIEAGLLRLANAAALPDHSALTMAGGALDLNGLPLTVSSLAGNGGAITNSGAGLTVDQAINTTYGGPIVGTGSLTKTGAGTWTLGGSNTYSGATRVAGGTLKVADSVTAHLRHRWSFNNNDLSDSVGGQTATVVAGSDSHVTWDNHQITMPGGDWGLADYISLGANILPNAADAPATIELWATQRSVQRWSRIFDFGDSTDNFIFMSWTQDVTYDQDRVSVNRGSGEQVADNTMAPYELDTEYHIALVITPGAGDGGQTLLQWYRQDASGATRKAGSMSVDWDLSQLIQNNMWLGTSKWVPSGDQFANASYNEVRIWDTALTEAQLAANAVYGPDAIPQSVLPAATTVTISNSSVLDLSGASDQTVASLASTDGLGSQIILGAASLAVGDAGSTTFDGSISGPGTLIKRGAGTFTLSGANTCGATIVSNGVLVVSGAIGPGAVTVANSAGLGGTGIISGAVVSDGIVTLGDNATFWLLSLPSYAQHASAALNVKVGGTTSPGTDYDQLSVSGTTTLGGTLHVMLANSYTPSLGDAVVVVQAAAGVSGSFSAVDGPALAGGLSWYVTYESNTATLRVVHRDNQTIAFDPIADQDWSSPLTLQATASSGLPVLFTVLSGPATIADGSNVTFTAAGTITIVATQPGNIGYWPAPPMTNTFYAYGYFTLTVVSEHGTASPAPGDYTGVFSEAVLTNQVTPLEIAGNTHYYCRGWTLAGAIPASGTDSSMVMSMASDCVLTWLWATNYWNGTVQYWTGAGTAADTIDQSDNWSSWSPPSPGDNLNFSNTTGSRHNPTSNYGAASYFGNLISYDGAGGITWSGDKTWLLSFENNSDANPLAARADLSNRTGPDTDLAINPLGSGGVVVSNVDIQNGMTLQVNGANTLTVNGALTQSGPGNASLAMHGNGTVILNGSNAFAGGTWIDTGTLQIGTGGTSGELGLGPVTNNGALLYARSDAQTWANSISGTGWLEKLGNGTLTLSGENTYAGETRIAGGTLHLMPGVGTDLVTIVAPLPAATTVILSNSGVLDVGDVTNQTVVSIATDDPGSQLRLGTTGLDLTGDADTLFRGVISGIGGLTKHGAGMLTLAGDNTYGGVTRILEGTLQIGDNGAAGILSQGSVLDNGTLIFNRSGTQTWHNVISGTGDLTKLGAGTLTLDGASTYGGATRVAGGTLQLLPAASPHLVHRWSFNGDLRDSVGGQDATIVAGTDFHATTNANQVTLPGGNGDAADYISLGANILPDTYAGVTIELWASQLSVQTWSRIFDFGNDPWNRVMMSWTLDSNPNADRVEVSGAGGNTTDNTMSPYELGIEYHIAMVLTPGAGTARHQTLLQWYKMDASGNTLNSGSMLLDWSLANLNQNNMWLGAPKPYPWPSGEQNANASYNEVRIWDTALTASQLATNSVLGPDALPDPITLPPGAPLPAGTAITFSNGGALELSNGVVQTVASIASTDGLGSRIRLDDSLLAVGNGSDATFDGVISGDGSLIKRGDATLTLTGANTLAGDLVILRGAVQIGDSGTSGTLGLGHVLDDSTLIYNRQDAQTWSNVIVGVGSVEKRGAGTLTLAGANTYAGETRIAGGTLQLAPALSAHLLHRWSFNGDLGDSVGGQPAAIVRGTTAHAATNAAQVTLPGGNWGEADYISLGANILPHTADSATTIELWATQHSVQNWSRILDFGSASWDCLFMSWTQGTDYNSDDVWFDWYSAGNTMAPYTTNVEYHIALVITPGAGDSGQTLLQWYKMDAAGTTLGTGSMSVMRTLDQLGQNNMWLGASESGPTGDQNANASYNEVRIWDLALTEAQLAANSVLGPDALPAPAALPLVSPLPATTVVTLSNGGALNLGNIATQAVARVSTTDGSGSRIAIGGSTLMAGDWWDTTFDGVFDGTGNFVKRGFGTLTLSGTNPFGGHLTVDTGTLQVNGAQGASAVSVTAGATLSGSGAIGGAVTCDGTVAPGSRDTIGTLAVTNCTLNNSGALHIRVGGAETAGVDYDRLRVSGSAQLDGTLYMEIVNGYTLRSNNVFTVLQADGGVSGRFYAVVPAPDDPTLSWHVHYGPTSVQLSLVTNYVLQVVSDAGDAAPAPGLHGYLPGTVLTNIAITPYTQGNTQYVCRGWTLSGGTTAAGAGASMVMTVTGDATLTWLWQTNYWLATAAGLNGSVSVASGWQTMGVTTAVTATAAQYYHFTNWTGSASANANPLFLVMNVPQSVAANFAPDMTSSAPVPVPHWWLAQYGCTSNFEVVVTNAANANKMPWWAAYVAGTNPTNPASVLAITNLVIVPGIRNTLTWPSVAGRMYGLDSTTNLLKGFTPLSNATNLPATPPVNVYTNTSGSLPAKLFYRLRVWMAP